MLSQLTIKNYALIDELNVSFGNGLTIITGETGAGKSILLGGLSLVLGKRADLTNVKDSSKKCIVEATFDIANYNLKPLFNEEDLDYEPITIIRREILPSGKSRAFVNDTPVKLDSLQLLGKSLLDIHSQHQTLQLTNDDFQFQIIDALANNSETLIKYEAVLSEFKLAHNELNKLKDQKTEALKELDYNRFLLNELTDANIKDGELEDLEREYETLNNVEEIKDGLSNSYQRLANEDIGVLSGLTDIKQHLSRISAFGASYNELFERVNSAVIELNDLIAEIELLESNLDADPMRLEVVNTKLQTLHNLMQKHTAANTNELLQIQEDLESKVSDTESLDAMILEKEQSIAHLNSKLKSLSDKISKNRHDVLNKLTDQLEEILATLGMPNAKFDVKLYPSESFLTNGTDRLEFLFSANKGGKFNELKKAASGGELSRIMLAIKSILSRYTQLPTIMFDEIDTGVSGEISNKMGSIMQDMSKSMQVFTITHLPQIAAKGDTHYKVYKSDINNETQTQLTQLSHEDRIVEIAQMLGGVDVSNSALEHAKQLLN
ncbi:DNA repair protein RecN [Psychroserpens sp.]|uniref:DNA repair protein RecN n=1 Tax=Psychroserpens sp. TaxID=2020870 RepID=UPI001B2A885C|nr:DNA repair protein RecN [Psychroserpens sp.]MBO6606797.1 DNA repair protein RecN [Psychroserpens sp.]MBO6653500.1 DNA repair protein RecN [Psychroserpens sp.]MBO6680472.1 DNA repair protein RecN [Psychroserpens sp.]MBO6750569.1 DNA repair protein RecN [Psychroserpens sp.]MBO6915052.1 DNA repair protein RecN [Psychroserpens sp.]